MKQNLTLAALLLASLHLTAAPAKPPVNILFIITDQQHAGMLSCAGNPYLKTPMVDSLAATGARFELAYCANPVCMPSRISMMTGVFPSRVGVETNGKSKAKMTPEVLENSLGRVFAKAGYETVYGGKAHLPMTLEDVGFKNIENDGRDKLAETCAKFLRQSHDRPFLMVASFINPHDICMMAIEDTKHPGKITGPKALVEAMALPPGMSREEFFAHVCPPLPANFEIPKGEPEDILAADPQDFRTYARNKWTDEQWRLYRWAYARLTERADAEIGVVLAALRETGLDQNTLVVFSSDHGDMDAAHRLEHKSVFYEEASRVPLIVSWKSVTQPGLVDRKHLVSTGHDLIPTLCDFAGVPVPSSLKGRSLRALAEGRTPPSWRDTLVVENGSSRMVRSARYKYVVYASGARREQLTDLVADPGEMKNLALDPQAAPVLAEHRRLLRQWYQQNGENLDSKYVVSGK
ncbi:MAG: sulfatase-like hydrolase/transferase [Verrucomicrobiae bacterium]